MHADSQTLLTGTAPLSIGAMLTGIATNSIVAVGAGASLAISGLAAALTLDHFS